VRGLCAPYFAGAEAYPAYRGQAQAGIHFSTWSLGSEKVQFQNPGNGTPKHSALSVFLHDLTQDWACQVFALEHFPANVFPVGS